MTPFKVGDWVSHVRKPHRGVASITALVDGVAVIKYPEFILEGTKRQASLTVPNVRIRDLKLEEAPK